MVEPEAMAVGKNLRGIAFGLALLVLAASPAAAAAAPAVTTTEDGGAGSLREAVALAAPGETVSVPSGTYVLKLGELVIEKDLTLAGAGAGSTTIEADGEFRVIDVTKAAQKVTISGVTIRNGHPHAIVAEGGGIFSQAAQLTLNADTVTENIADATAPGKGGGIAEGGGVSVHNESKASIAVVDSTISENVADANGDTGMTGGIAEGGGLYVRFAGGASVTGTTFVGNRAWTVGGGIANGAGAFFRDNLGAGSISDSTFSGNLVESDSIAEGGGLSREEGQAPFEVDRVTFFGNTSRSSESKGRGGASGDRRRHQSPSRNHRRDARRHFEPRRQRALDRAQRKSRRHRDQRRHRSPGRRKLLRTGARLGDLARLQPRQHRPVWLRRPRRPRRPRSPTDTAGRQRGRHRDAPTGADQPAGVNAGAAFGLTSDQRGLPRPVGYRASATRPRPAPTGLTSAPSSCSRGGAALPRASAAADRLPAGQAEAEPEERDREPADHLQQAGDRDAGPRRQGPEDAAALPRRGRPARRSSSPRAAAPARSCANAAVASSGSRSPSRLPTSPPPAPTARRRWSSPRTAATGDNGRRWAGLYDRRVESSSSSSSGLAFESKAGRWLLAVSVLGSGMAFLDGTVVNVALPDIGRDFGATHQRPAVDPQRLPADPGLADPARRLPRRPLRAAADLRPRRRPLHPRLAALRGGAERSSC